MKVRILGSPESDAYIAAQEVVMKLGHLAKFDGEADVAIAPLLTEKLSIDDIRRPRLGTLIFHPSPLPYGRGGASIRWAYKRGEPITAATWFWADEGLDTGPICELEIVRINYLVRPRDFYKDEIIPAMCRTLARCLNSLQIGYKREIPQVEAYASFDRK